MPGGYAKAIPCFVPVTRASPFDRPQGRIPVSLPTFPSSPYMEFYCDPVNGDNMNGGSNEGAAIYSTTNGNWDSTNRIFTPTDGTNPVAAGVRQGQYMSVFIDGATTPSYIQMVYIVENAVNGRIFGNINYNNGATPPTTSATGRSVRVGGAFKGPNGSVGWPLTNGIGTSCGGSPSVASAPVRVNYKNNGLYSITAALTAGFLGGVTHQGYSQVPGDGGKANLDGGSNAIVLLNSSFTVSGTCSDFIFSNNGSSGTNNLITLGGSVQCIWVRCVFHDGRGGMSIGGGVFIECEFYNLNTANTAGIYAITNGVNLPIIFYQCYFHDCNAGGIKSSTGYHTMLIECIFDSLTGICIDVAANPLLVFVVNSDFYNCGTVYKNDYQTAMNNLLFFNNNFTKMSGFVFNFVNTNFGTTCPSTGLLYNNKFGGGTERNSPSDFNPAMRARQNPSIGLLDGLIELGSARYNENESPYSDPLTGNFSLSNRKSWNTGRFNLTQIGAKTGTVGYPDTGAAAHIDVGSSALELSHSTFPYGYLNHFYAVKQDFASPATVTLQTGSLPTGLSLSQPATTSFLISGTPAALGVFDFSLRLTIGSQYLDFFFQITILDDPDEGAGGVGGG